MGKNVIISTLPNISQNYLPKVNTSNIFANSLVYDNGTNVMVNTTATHADYTNARLVVNNTGNSYLEVRGNGGQGTIALTTSTSTTSNFPTVEIFNSADFGIVGYRPGVVSSNYIMYYELSSSTNRRLTFQTEGQNRLIINQNGTAQFTQALTGTSATFSANVGLGSTFTNSAGYTRLLNVYDASSAAVGISIASNDYQLGVESDGGFRIRYNGTQRFLMSNTGAATFSAGVGINGATLQTGLGAGLTIEGATYAPAYFSNSGTLRGFVSGYSGGLLIQASTGNLTLNNSGGNVGIGTTSPQSITNGLSLTIGDSATQHQPYLAFRRNSTGGYWAGINWYDGTTRKSFIEENANFDLRFGTSNALAMIITSGGNVGIGTTSPSVIANYNALTINGTNGSFTEYQQGGAFAFRIGSDASIGGFLNQTDANPIRIFTNAAERMRITSGGNVGIGTTSPQSTLEINGGNTYFPSKILTLSGAENTRYNGFIGLNLIAGSQLAMSLGTRSNNTDYANTLNLYQGNVGIGTASPFARLHIQGTPDANYGNMTSFDDRSAAINQGGMITFSGYKTATSSAAIFAQIAGRKENSTAGNEAGYLTFLTNDNGTYQERMRITSGGRVIINNSVPNDSGDRNLTIQGSLSANNQDVASINLTQVWNGVSYPAIVAAQIGDSVGVASSKMVFKTTAWNGSAAITSLRMTITENGNIGAPSGSNIYNASDLRLKKNISSITDGLNKVLNLNPVMFNWVDDFVKEENGKDMLGFIAQEVQEIIPQAVEDFGSNTIAIGETIVKNPLRVNEKFIIPVLVKAIQELKAENDQQKADIESLKALINK